jgi:Uncharacterised protein conserved in bacteria (DUF2336)
MVAASSLIPELDEIVRAGDPKRQTEAARRIADLFFAGAANFRADHVDLFDGVLRDLVPHTELVARVELAERLSSLANAPRGLVSQLAREDEAAIAAPLLRRSPVLDQTTLIDIARTKGQGHLLAISDRATLSRELTDVIVHRGDREVIRRAAGNRGALFSENGYAELVRRASHDGILTLTVGQREDLPQSQLKDLLLASMEPVRQRLLEIAAPERKAAIKQAISDLADLVEPPDRPRNFQAALGTVFALKDAGELNEAALLGFAKEHKYEESIAALSVMSAVRITTLDRLISADRYDPILIVSKMIGLQWATVRALILLRMGPGRTPSPADMESARVNFSRLMPSTAERVVGFWQTR